MNTIEETKIEDDPFSITTPPPSPPSLLNHHHQRLSYSISFNNNNNNSHHYHHSSSTLLHRSQSLALDDQHYKKKKPNHLNKLWKNHHIDKELPITPTIILSQSPMDRILATSPPTLIEFHQWILHYLSNIEETINIELLNIQHHQHNNNHQEIISKLVIAKDCLLRLINTLDDKLVLKNNIINKLHSISFQSMGINEILQILQHSHSSLQSCLTYHTELIDTLTESSIMEIPCLTSNSIDYTSLWPDHLDANIHWFHDNFCGKDYLTLFIPLLPTKSTTTFQNNNNNNNATYAVVNIIHELISTTSTFLKTSSDEEEEDVFSTMDDNGDINDIENSQYRIIIRIPRRFTKRYIVTCAQAYDYMNKHGGLNVSFKTTKSNRKSLKLNQLSPHFSSQYRYLSAALHSVCPELNFNHAILLNSTLTSSCGIEKELLHLDGIEAPPSYKFGVLNIKKNQTKEEEFFANTGLSTSFDHFLRILGDRIPLKGYRGYTAGLDTRTGETGDTSVVSKWRGHDIMFHVAPLMPFLKNDKQQVQRKRYIGNDIVSVIFLEGDSQFNPESIRSKFLHVYIVVRQEKIDGKIGWRVEVVRRNNVPEFGPSLPTPPVFYDENTLRQFLTIKLINAENAALKSENFLVPNFRARGGILENIVEKGINQKESIPMSSLIATKTFKQRRPKSSSGSQRLSRASLRSIRSSPDSSSYYTSSSFTNQQQSPPIDVIPPMPTPTRSTMLQDLKNFALRRAPTLTQPKSASSSSSKTDGKSNNMESDDTSLSKDDSTTTAQQQQQQQQTKKPSYTTSFPSIASNLLFRQNGNPNDDEPIVQSNKNGGSILAAKARTVFFNKTTSSASLSFNGQPPKPKKTFSTTSTTTTTTTTTTTGQQHQNENIGFRHKAQNLMINVVGRRSGQNGNQHPIMPTLKE